MGMKKVLMVCLILLICLFSVNTFALDNTIEITPNWTSLDSPGQSFSIANGKAEISAVTTARNSANQVAVSAYLQQLQNGTWTNIKSWSDLKAGTIVSINQTYYVVKGYYYRLVTYHTAYYSGTSESVSLTG